MVGHISRRRPLGISVSEELDSTLSGDLVLIGLPGKNVASRKALAHLKSRHPEIRLTISESDKPRGGVQIGLGDFCEDFRLTFQAANKKIPDRDLAVIVLWVNPLARQKRRLLLCAGITAYSTAGAAGYLVNDIVDYRYKQLRKANRRALPSLLSPGTWACFAMVIEVLLINDQITQIRECAFAPIPDPGRPPWA